MNETRLFFVRHAESIANAGGITMNHALIPLSSNGVAQAAALATGLDILPARVYVSKYVRTQETARPYCARTGAQSEVHPLLHEFSSLDPDRLIGMSGAQRRPIADAYWNMADPDARMGLAAETFKEFTARVDEFLLEMHSLPDRSVLFGHGIWFGMLCWKLAGNRADTSAEMKSFRQYQRSMSMANCCIYIVSRRGSGAWTWTGPVTAADGKPDHHQPR
jgi:broad specificity phosphatase PhoE